MWYLCPNFHFSCQDFNHSSTTLVNEFYSVMKKRKVLRFVIILIFVGVVAGVSIAYYLFNMPHRDIQHAKVDYSLSSSELVQEYLDDSDQANSKYLAANGNSKILELSGEIRKISANLKGQHVILIQSTQDKAGVSATLNSEIRQPTSTLQVGQKIKLKGVIRSGASYDEDMEIYRNVIIDKAIIQQTH